MTIDDLGRAFAVGAFVSLLATPVARRLAVRRQFLDQPGAHKGHARPVPYLGGLAIIVATLMAATVGGAVGPTTGRILLVATVLGAVGLVDDSRPLGVAPRLACQLLGAALILGAGVRFQLTGSPVVDGAISLVWIVGVTNGFNLLDNMDGLSAGAASLAGLAVAGVALAEGQPGLALVALAMVGACAGFLAFNADPASIFMGDAGSMFLGAMVAALTLAVRPPGTAGNRLVVPLLIVGLPLVDTITVTVARFRRRLPVMLGRRDHLSHRLVGLGLGRRAAVRTLLAAGAVSAALAVLVARGVLGPWVALVVAAMPFGALAIWTTRRPVYDTPVVGRAAPLTTAVLGVIVVVAGLSVPAVLAMLGSRSALRSGTAALVRALDEESAGHGGAAAADLAAAHAHFADASRDLGQPGVGLGRVVPVVAVNLRAARVVAATGAAVSGAATELAGQSDLDEVAGQSGAVDLAALKGLTPRLDAAEQALATSLAEVRGVPRTLLLPSVGRDLASLDARLSAGVEQTQTLAQAAQLLPDLLGGSGPRRYLVLVEDGNDPRASGGVLAGYGELLADGGHVTAGPFGAPGALDAAPGTFREAVAPADYLARYARFSPFDQWENLNVSPDFATAAALAAQLYPESGGRPVDGVIAMDQVSLADLLGVTGPVTVPGWPVPVGGTDVVSTSELAGVVGTIGSGQGNAPSGLGVGPSGSGSAAVPSGLLGAVAQAAVVALGGPDQASPLQLLRALAGAVAQHHLQLWLSAPGEERLVDRLHAAAALGAASGDTLLVTTQDAGGAATGGGSGVNRSVSYQLRLRPVGDDLEGARTAQASGTVQVELGDDAAVPGVPAAPAGASSGTRTFVSVYTPLAVTGASLDGRPLTLESSEELGENAYSTFVEVTPGAVVRLNFQVQGTVPLAADGWYALALPSQPALSPGQEKVQVSVAGGWELLPSDGLARTSVLVTPAGDVGGEVKLQVARTGPLRWLAPVPSSLAGAPSSQPG